MAQVIDLNRMLRNVRMVGKFVKLVEHDTYTFVYYGGDWVVYFHDVKDALKFIVNHMEDEDLSKV